MIPRLHLVTDDETLAREGFLSRAASALEAGGGRVALHLRGPRTPGRVLYSLALELRGPAAEAEAPILVNDRLDVAMALGLPGAHLGQRSMPPLVARELLGHHALLGLSVHGLEEARRGAGSGVDFFLVGTIFSTPSHPDRTPAGSHRLEEVREGSSLPLVAIGGVTPDRVGEVMSAGAHGAAVLRGVWEARDPGAAVRGYLDEMEAALGDEAGPVRDEAGNREGSP